MLRMSPRQEFLFDVQGYLRIPAVLSPAEVDRLNAAIDAQADLSADDANRHDGGTPALATGRPRSQLRGLLTLAQPWCQPFRDLLAHAGIRPALTSLLGPGWRMDHEPFVMLSDTGAEGLVLHGPGRTLPLAEVSYRYLGGRMLCGMVTVEFALTDVGPDDGGFAVVPGSHKANFPCPPEIITCEDAEGVVQTVPCRAGDVVVFTEATLHGTLPWRGKHQRRAAFYRYSPRSMHLAGGMHVVTMPEWTQELTEEQRAILEPPYIYNRPFLDESGVSTTLQSV